MNCVGHPGKITATLNGGAHPFFRMANVTRGDKGVGDKPAIGELGGSPAWNWMRVAENTFPAGANRHVYEHVPEGGWERHGPTATTIGRTRRLNTRVGW